MKKHEKIDEFIEIDLLKIPVVYINLKKDYKKNKEIIQQLNYLNFEKIIRCEGIDSKIKFNNDDGSKWSNKKYNYACNRSYLKSLCKVKETPILILEDDARFFENNFKKNIVIPKNADLLYFGGGSDRYVEKYKIEKIDEKNPFIQTSNKNILIVKNQMVNTHAFLLLNNNIRDNIIKKIISDMDNNFDNILGTMQNEYNFYAYNPPMFYQILQGSINPYDYASIKENNI